MSTSGTQFSGLHARGRIGDQYAARHNPFVYFHSIINTSACAANDVPQTNLTNDLKGIGTTPNFPSLRPIFVTMATIRRVWTDAPVVWHKSTRF